MATGSSPATLQPLRRRGEVFGYCMFDFANSSFTTLISTVAYSFYFRQAVVGADDSRADLLWGIAAATSHAVLILTAPMLGAIADHSGRKKAFLLLSTVVTVLACAMLFWVRPGSVGLGMGLFILAAIGFESGYIFYNAFLPEVSTPKTIGRISAWSWGTGFVGGLLALAACFPLLVRPLLDPETGAPDATAVLRYRISFVVVAAFFALFALPTFLLLRETGRRRGGSPASYVTAGFRRVTGTLRDLRRYRQTARFVVAALLFYGGIETVIKFSSIYASVSFGIDGAQRLLLFIFANVVAVPGTLIAGHLADRIGGKRALAWTLVLWCGLILVGALTTRAVVFWMVAGGIAIGMGSTQAIGRSFMSQLSPPDKESEFFGFYILAGKAGSIVSLLLFGVIASATGNQRLAVLWMLPLFLLGLLAVLSIDEREAIAQVNGSHEAGGPASP